MMTGMGRMTILLVALAVPAQVPGQARRRGPTGQSDVANRERARELSADRIIRFRKRLDLSDEQVERVKQALGADREVQDALRLETRGIRDRLRDEEITREEFRDEMQGRRREAVDGTIAYREALENILTDEQRTRMRALGRRENRSRGVSGRGSQNMRRRARGQYSRGAEPPGPSGRFRH